MRRLAFAFASGGLFSMGLVLGGMTQPGKVRGFLDVLGAWDASLSLVMVGAVSVFALLYRLSLRRNEPLYGGSFQLPGAKLIDARLLGGAALFGVGWGLSGLCPGPALVALVSGDARVLAFALTMLLGMRLADALSSRRAAPAGAP